MSIDWSTVVLSLLKTMKKDAVEINPEHLVIKPRLFDDDNQLKALAALRTVLAFIPSIQLASSVLGLGETGFKIWKAIALRKDYSYLTLPVLGVNSLSFIVENDPVLAENFSYLIEEKHWAELQRIYEDFSFITESTILREKYPKVPITYIEERVRINQALLGKSLDKIEQEILKKKSVPEIDANLRGALEALKEIFPSMRNWALVSSERFDEVVEIIDTLV